MDFSSKLLIQQTAYADFDAEDNRIKNQIEDEDNIHSSDDLNT